jgi:hypothetical protein
MGEMMRWILLFVAVAVTILALGSALHLILEPTGTSNAWSSVIRHGGGVAFLLDLWAYKAFPRTRVAGPQNTVVLRNETDERIERFR